MKPQDTRDSVTLAKDPGVARIRAVAIGASTGGPQALRILFQGLASHFPPVPFFITQHMSSAILPVLAEQLAEDSGRPCKQAEEGDIVTPTTTYLAPGGRHLIAEQQGKECRLHLRAGTLVHYCCPAVDPMLQSLAPIYGRGLLAIILTGIGEDGLEGVESVLQAGGRVVAQDKQSSVVWGMPRAVALAGACHALLPLAAIAPYILETSL